MRPGAPRTRWTRVSYVSSIEWTESTWNPVTGCSKVSKGCVNCYAERLARRLEAEGNPRYRNGFRVTLHHDLLWLPVTWRKPRLVFVNSMSDLFHELVPVEFIGRVFEVMQRCSGHVFQVLTKRSTRLRQLASSLSWPDNVWVGVTVESEEYVWRITDLRTVPARIRFLSLEPLLSPLPNIRLDGIHWVVVGGESGPSARPMSPTWVRDIRDRCLSTGTPFFFKQWGGIRRNAAGRLLDGVLWNQMPETMSTRGLAQAGTD